MEIEDIFEKYSERMENHLNVLRDEMREYLQNEVPDAYITTVHEAYGDVYGFVMYLVHPKHQTLNIIFEIINSEDFGHDNGMAFRIEGVSAKGDWTCHCTPFNFTPDIWVARNDEQAIEERFKLVQQVDSSEFSYQVCEWLKS